MFILQSNHPSASMLYHQYDETLWNTNSSAQWFQSHCVIVMLEVASDTILQTFGNWRTGPRKTCWPSVSWLTSSWWLTAFVVGLEIFFFVTFIIFFIKVLHLFQNSLSLQYTCSDQELSHKMVIVAWRYHCGQGESVCRVLVWLRHIFADENHLHHT